MCPQLIQQPEYPAHRQDFILNPSDRSSHVKSYLLFQGFLLFSSPLHCYLFTKPQTCMYLKGVFANTLTSQCIA